jgi:translation initiation factor 5
MINIRRDVKDLYYRYKMPRLVSKIEGKGNGIKTVVSNMVDIAKALNRPPVYVTKFFGSEVGSLTVCDEKAARYIVNGAHEAEKLQNVLDGFISKFVLCPSCENPETDLSVSKDGTIWRNCKACGHRATVDMAHKLCTYIQKNPPPKPKKIGNANKGATSSGDAGVTLDDKSGDSASASAGADGEVEEGMTAPEGIDSGFIRTSNGFAADDDDWTQTTDLDKSKEIASLSERVRKSLNLELADPLDEFGTFLDANLSISNADLLKEIEDREIRADRALAAVIQILVRPEALMASFTQRLLVIQTLVGMSEPRARGVKALFGSIERLLAHLHPKLITACPALLQLAYQNDLFDDDEIIAWNGHISKRYVSKDEAEKIRKAAEPFVNWVQNAESDDDDEDSGDDDDDEE